MLSLVAKQQPVRVLLAFACAFALTHSVDAQEATTSSTPTPSTPEATPNDAPEAAVVAEPAVTAPEPVAVTAPTAITAPAADTTPPAAPVAAPAAPAATPVGLKVTGSFFTRYEVRENYDQFAQPARFTESDVAVFRGRLGLATTPIDVGAGEQVVLQFTPQASGIVGALPGTVADAALGLHEGYLRIQGATHKLDIGRFEMNYGDALVIGNLDWNETGRSFDGMRVRLTPSVEKTFVDVFLTQANPNAVATAGEGGRALNNPLGAGDTYFTGIYAGLGAFIDPAMELEPYFLALLRPGTDIPGNPMAMPPTVDAHTNASTLFTLGTRFKHKIDVIDLRAEGGLQFGGVGATGPVDMVPDGQSVFAFQIDAEAGVSLLDNKLRVGVEGLYASGNDPDTADKVEGWNQLFPTAHKFMGLMDIIGARTNVASGVLHVSAQPTADIKASFDAHYFVRPQATTAMADNSGSAGAILDFGLAYALGTGLNLRGLYGLFLPGEDVYGPDLDPAHYVEIELRYDLK